MVCSSYSLPGSKITFVQEVDSVPNELITGQIAEPFLLQTVSDTIKVLELGPVDGDHELNRLETSFSLPSDAVREE